MRTQIRYSFNLAAGTAALAQIESLAEGLVRLNEVFFATHPGAPDDLVIAGVRYEDPLLCRERSVQAFCQTIRGAGQVLQAKRGTCIDLSAYYVGLWRVRFGVDSYVRAMPDTDGRGQPIPNAFHAVAVYPGGVFDAAQQVRDRVSLEAA